MKHNLVTITTYLQYEQNTMSEDIIELIIAAIVAITMIALYYKYD